MKRKVPRTCIGCGEVKDKSAMLRIVKLPSGEIHPDDSGRMSGRGAYICFSAECLEKAVKKHGFERAFKAQISDDSIGKISGFINDRG